MKNIFKFIGIIIVSSAIYSCSLKEQYEPVSDGGAVEFVARILNFNNVDVATKASSEIETDIYTAYLLLFDKATGDRIHFTPVTANDGSFSQTITDPSLWRSSVTACFIANVPHSFAEGIEGLTKPDGAPESDNNKYLDSAVLPITYENGVPVLNHDNKSVECIPMIGTKDVDNLTNGHILEVPVTRLFAKVTVKLTLNVDVDWNMGELWDPTIFKLNSCSVNNIPKFVGLIAPSEGMDSPWSSGDFPREEYNPNIGQNGVTINNKSNNSYYTLSFYVPEYYLQPLSKEEYTSNGYAEDTYNTERYKPKMYDTAKCPVHLELQGTYEPTSGNKVSLKYLVYLGEDEKSNFTLKRNKHYTNQLTITGVRYSMTDEVYIDHRVEIDPELSLDDITGETANCYLICDEGTYYFPAVKGAYKKSDIKETDYCGEGRVVILAKDNADIGIDNYSFNPKDKTIVFDVTKVVNGNAVIALLDESNQIQWSWHLWMNTGFQLFGSELTEFELNIHDVSDEYKLIDMNLGAKSGIITLLNPNDPIGAYYRSGLRQPYFYNVLPDDPDLEVDTHGYGYQGGLTEKATWNGDTKSRTDPCPPGYRVPSTDAWGGFNPSDMYNDATLGGFHFYSRGLITINYPYSGAVNEKNVIIDGTEGGKTKKDYNKEIVIGDHISVTNPGNKAAVKYTNISYNVIDIAYEGFLQARNDEKTQRYGYESEGLEIITCKRVTTTKWKRTGIIIKRYEADFSDSKYVTEKTFTGIELQKDNAEHFDDILYEINGGFFGSLGDWISGYWDKVIFEPKDIKTNYGYQVRCEKEN